MTNTRFFIDQIILARITNDERPLKRVIKKFHNYTSISYTPVVPAVVPAGGSATTADDAREAFLVELATFQLSLKKSVMICEAEARQVEEYQRERQRIGEFGGAPVSRINAVPWTQTMNMENYEGK